ncbi:MAG: hypothetical protein Q4B15_06205 [Lachnospiraceae bacterium]|nr:hypothetical protein [Lachnospiraceae bacterium]
MNGYTPEFVARELFERGVLSAIPSMLLKMITGGEYQALEAHDQTTMIQSLNLSPSEIERSITIMNKNMKRSLELVKSLRSSSHKDLLLLLHRIGCGDAVSKTEGCMCLMTALGRECPFPGQTNCPACEYEISTKTTMFLMVQEVKRLKREHQSTKSPFLKNKYAVMARDIVLPAITGMLVSAEEVYGKESMKALELIVQEATHE